MRSRVGLVIRTAALATFLLLSLAQPGWAVSLQLVDEFGSAGTGAGQFRSVVDLEVAPNGNLVVSDAGNGRIQVFTPNGNFVRAFGSSGSGPGQFFLPAGVAVRGDGSIFAHDAGNRRVEVFTAAGAFVRQFQTPGLAYADAAFDPADASLYLVDYQAGNIQRVSTTGADMGLFGSSGTGNGQFQRPQGIAVDSSGNVYVADRDNNRVQKLGPSGGFLAKFGGVGSAPGQMRTPFDVAIGAGGNVLVADDGNDRLQEFSPAGQFIASYDRIAGSPTPAFRPAVLTAAPSGDIYLYDNRLERILRVRAQPAPPVLGKSVNVSPLSGTVLVRARGTKKFRVLGAGDSIPVGSSIDTTRGRVRLSSAKKGGGTQTGVFFDGRFRVAQSRRSGLTDLKLEGGNFGSCRGGARGVKGGPRVVRRLWGHGKGRTRTSGHNGAGTVRGTFWLTEDRCDGTFFKVRQGVVVVRDFTRHRNVVLHAGDQYLAPAR